MVQQPPRYRLRRMVSRAGLAALRLLRTHYFTLTSAAIIAVLFALVMTSDSFGSRKGNSGDVRPPVAPAEQVVAFKAPRRSVLFYVVEDQQQLNSLSDAFAADQAARADGPFAVDLVVFLLAGTQEQESAAIARLNFEASLVQGGNVDMKVVDVRGRFDR
jgi:hypothetical protein